MSTADIIERLVAALDAVHTPSAAARAEEIDAAEWQRLREGRPQRPADPAELYRVAVHEAGHCIISVKLGHPVDCTLIQRDGTGETRLAPHHDTPDVAAMIHLGGPCADLYGGVERSLPGLAHSHDLLKARAALDKSQHTAHEVVSRRVAIVADNWSAIGRVASRLRTHGEVSGWDLLGLMHERRQ